jgi:hypothetical protein
LSVGVWLEEKIWSALREGGRFLLAIGWGELHISRIGTVSVRALLKMRRDDRWRRVMGPLSEERESNAPIVVGGGE